MLSPSYWLSAKKDKVMIFYIDSQEYRKKIEKNYTQIKEWQYNAYKEIFEDHKTA